MKQTSIDIKGARVHNLKNIDVSIPRDKLIVITGLSGSGKSSLAFDTIYAEGQRRYVESLSAYARQFLGQMDKPDVDSIEGLSPAISIDQKTTNRNPRSTVGTITEIYDFLRLLYARVGKPHCPIHGVPIDAQTIEQMVDRVLSYPEKTRIQILAPLVDGRKGEHQKVFEDIRKKGFVRARVDGEIIDIDEEISLEKNKKHTIEVVVDRIVIKPGIEARLADSFETALTMTDEKVLVDINGEEELLFSQKLACSICGFSMDELAPRMFSFNSPYGACTTCDGLGNKMEIDTDLVVPDKNKTLREGAIEPWAGITSNYYPQFLEAMCKHIGLDFDTPYSEIPDDKLQKILYGSNGERIRFTFTNDMGSTRTGTPVFEGIIPNLERRYQETASEYVREHIEHYMSETPCPACKGARLKPEILAVLVAGRNIDYVTRLSIGDAVKFFSTIELSAKDALIADAILKEINERLGFLENVGLDYLNLSRAAGTLSGGEAQRTRLATQISSNLMGVLYILDEPSIGLHQRDNSKLLATLKRLRDLGNTLIVVEHDEETMLSADVILDIGPGAGIHGGEVVALGTPEEIMNCDNCLTGKYLSGKKMIATPAKRREPNGNWLEIKGARENNLKNIDVKIPLGVFVAVTGVSGSGKSSLINRILYNGLARELQRSRERAGAFAEILGTENLDRVVEINQAPIGRTPRSNPATYTGVFDEIRSLFAETNEAKVRGYKKGRFSFNVKGGRCETCRGDGIIKIEMHFLPDVYVACEVCKGKRYNRETLDIKYKGKTISDVLETTVEDALEFFENIPRIKRKLQTIYDVGLGYIKLGQSSTTLSGGEAQRVKLASELYKRSNGRTLYILDEPTTGLHIDDVSRLLQVLQQLVENGDSVVVIEHNMDVIKTADYVIDLGPEGGDGGGRVLTTGTPEQVAKVAKSYTGQYLKQTLARDKEKLNKNKKTK
jgi:excinuclease ABC subunit A